MYSRPESEQYDTKWLEAERDLAIRSFELPWSPERAQEVPLNSEDVISPPLTDRESRREFTKDDFVKALKKVAHPLDKGQM